MYGLFLHGVWPSLMTLPTNLTASLVLDPQPFAALPVPPFESIEAGGGFDSSGIWLEAMLKPIVCLKADVPREYVCINRLYIEYLLTSKENIKILKKSRSHKSNINQNKFHHLSGKWILPE